MKGQEAAMSQYTVVVVSLGYESYDNELQTRGAREIVRVLSGGLPHCWVNRW
jgi:hypothetical protein